MEQAKPTLHNQRKWYEKKRFMIPLGLFGFLILLGIVTPDKPKNDTISRNANTEVKSDTITLPAPPTPIHIIQTDSEKAPTQTDSPDSAPRTKTQENSPTPTPKNALVAPQAQSNCDPNYSGCVPIASDVDCAGGSGNGPAYVKGPIQVIGRDIYGLDRDGNGTACE